MKALITGSNGQLGWELQRTRPDDWDIVALNRNELDITDSTAVSSAINKHQPDLVINTAAYTAVDKAESEKDKAYDVNANGTANIAKESEDSGVRLIHISTDFVFDGNKSQPYLPADKPNPTCVYGASKLQGEQDAISITNGKVLILRTSWVYSVHGTSKGTFNGLGMASLERDQQIAPAILELAETRAIARSLRFAGYGVEYCSAEEVSHLENEGLIEQTGRSESPVQDPGDKGSEKLAKQGENDGKNPQDARLTSKQLNYLKRLARDRRMTDKELRTRTMEAYKKQPEYLTKKEASELIDQLLTQEAV